jgi:hypothetical protein
MTADVVVDDTIDIIMSALIAVSGEHVTKTMTGRKQEDFSTNLTVKAPAIGDSFNTVYGVVDLSVTGRALLWEKKKNDVLLARLEELVRSEPWEDVLQKSQTDEEGQIDEIAATVAAHMADASKERMKT